MILWVADGPGSSIGFRLDRTPPCNRRPLRLHDRERPPVAVAEYVIGAGPVGERVLESDGIRIGDVPALILELRVDPNAGERSFVTAPEPRSGWA